MHYNHAYETDNDFELHTHVNQYQEADGRERVASSGCTSLHQAAKDGDVAAMRTMLNSIETSNNSKVNELDESNLAPLHYAAKYNHLEVARLLVQNEADVNQRGQDEATPLHYAASFKRSMPSVEQEEMLTYSSYLERYLHCRGLLLALRVQGDTNPSVIAFLVSAGADVNSKDNYGLTPLHFAAIRSDDVAALELLKCDIIDINAVDEQNMMPLHHACTHGRTDIAALILYRDQVQIRNPDMNNNIPLHLACRKGHAEIVNLLCSAAERQNCLGEMLTDTNNNGSPLYLAAGSGEREIVELFLEHGANANEVCRGRNTPLHAACESNNLETVRLLLERRAAINNRNSDEMTPLHKGCQEDNHEIVEFLLLKGAQAEATDRDGLTPLLTAAKAGHPSNIEVLLQFSASIGAKDNNGRTAFIWAAEEQQLGALQILGRHENANNVLDVRETRKGNTVLHVASEKGFLEIVKFLLDLQADIYAKNRDQNTPLRLAIQNGHVQCILEFVKQDRSFVNDEDENFNTPLHLAASAGHSSAVKCLIEAGADVRARNISSWTPLECAASIGCVESATMLLDENCPINDGDNATITPLHLASKNGHVDMVELLLERRADLSLRDTNNYNCLDFAIDNGHREVAFAIVRHNDWKRAVFSESTDPATGMRQTPLRKLIKLMPDVAEEVLNGCLTERGKPRHKDYCITFDYELLDDTFSNWNSNSTESAQSNFREGGRLSPDANPYSSNEEILITNHPLQIMVRSRRDNLLGHPLVTSLLDHKWSSYGRIFYYSSLLLYLIFLSFFTGFILVSPPPYFAFNVTANRSRVNWYETGKERWEEGFSDTALFLFGKVGHWIVVGLSCLNLFKEGFQVYNRRLAYINWENLLEWFVYILAILAVVPLSDIMYADDLVLRYDWQWQCGAFGIFLAWMNLILFIQNVPQLGIYVVMFTDVVKTFLKFCVVFFLFIVSFAMAFYTLLMNQQPFHRIKYSLVKTFVMMIGEFDFDGIFHSQDYLTETDLDNASEEYFLTKLFYSGSTYTIFIVFIIIMSILIMNLLVGLAVDDIQAVQEQAKLRRFCMQVDLAFHVQKALPMFIWRRSVIKSKTVYPNSRYSGLLRPLRWLTENDTALTDGLSTSQSSETGEIQLLAKRQKELLKDISKIKEQMEATSQSIENIKATNETLKQLMEDLLHR